MVGLFVFPVLEEQQSALANGATDGKGGEGGLRLAYYGKLTKDA